MGKIFVSKFVNYFFPPSKTMNLKNNIIIFQQKFEETFGEAWESCYYHPKWVSYDGPTIPPTPSPLLKEVERETEATKDKVQNTSLGSTAHVQPSVVQDLIPDPEVALKTNPKPSIPYPSRLNDQKLREKTNNQMMKFLQIFQRLHFDISFADALLHMPKFASTFKSLLIDYDVDPRVPLILGRPFLRTAQALIDVHEIKACLSSDSIPPGIDDTYFDPEGDIRLLEKLLNDDPSSPLPLKELNFEELKMIKSSIDDPLELELKDLPSHLEYAFLEETDKLPVIISKKLKDEEKAALLKVLKSHKRAIAWKISNIKGIDPRFCTHKILMEDDFKPMVQHQRRVNLKIHEVIKKEVIKLLDAGLIYPISDSPWVSPVYCVPKKGGITVVENEDNELIPTSTFQRCMMDIFHDMIEETMEVFMDDFSVFGDSFSSCLSHLDKILKRCKDTNLVLNWEKCHFMVKEGIVLGYKLSKSRIEVDRAKVDVIAKLPHLTFVKGVRSF
ncbi:reverse transcriptase domain-containing protein [Tanacetum coccineum]